LSDTCYLYPSTLSRILKNRDIAGQYVRVPKQETQKFLPKIRKMSWNFSFKSMWPCAISTDCFKTTVQGGVRTYWYEAPSCSIWQCSVWWRSDDDYKDDRILELRRWWENSITKVFNNIEAMEVKKRLIRN